MNNQKKIALVNQASKIISTNWGKNANAVNDSGDIVMITDPQACAFCAIGAIYRASHDMFLKNSSIASEIIDDLGELVFKKIPIESQRKNLHNLALFNDSLENQGPLLELLKNYAQSLES